MHKDKRTATVAIVLRWLAWVGILVFAAALQTTPRFLAFGTVRPLLVVPACLALALYKGEFAGALFGAAGGLLWDAAAGRVGGFFAIMLMIACFLASCLWQLYLRDNALNFFWITLLTVWFILSLDFMFSYWLRGYPNPGGYYLGVLLPSAALTSVVGLLLRPLARLPARIDLKRSRS